MLIELAKDGKDVVFVNNGLLLAKFRGSGAGLKAGIYRRQLVDGIKLLVGLEFPAGRSEQ